LDRIGSLYFTKENYDDFYYGKGSTYPDINGAIGILFEQASSRGHLQQTANGLLTFPFTIKNQFTTALSTLEGAKVLRKEFLQWQRDFYKNSVTEAATDPVKAYVFGDANDVAKTNLFMQMLRRHQIQFYALNKDIQADDHKFLKDVDIIVPLNQPQYKVIKTIFQKTLNYKDSLFYDITAWTMPLAFGLPSAELNAATFNESLQGNAVTEHITRAEIKGGKSDYGYLLQWSELFSPAALYELQSAGLLVKVATVPFQITLNGNNRSLKAGTLFVQVQMQNMPSDKIFSIVKNTSEKYACRSCFNGFCKCRQRPWQQQVYGRQQTFYSHDRWARRECHRCRRSLVFVGSKNEYAGNAFRDQCF
jgi:hypothetical protein